jgi:tRNA(Ile)-lysidine synthase
LRNQILPAIEIEIPAIHSSVITLMNCLQENQIRLETEAMRLVETIIESGTLDLDTISLLDATLTVELLRQLDISTTYLLEWNKLIDSQKGSKLIISQSKILISIIREENGFYFQFVLDTKIIEPQFRAFTVSVLPNEFSKSIIFFDKQKIKGEISMRLWKNGDRIYPLGVNGSKLISDVLTNSKIPHVERINQWVLVDEEKILACVHHCLDRRAIANQSTSDILCIEINH